MRQLSAFVVGLVFGLGLVVSQMMSPQKVINFLDVTGAWDPTLLVVMGSALAVAALGFRLTLRRETALLDARFQVTANNRIDRPLLLGAAVFGVGWGLAGFCPGPAFTALAVGGWEAVSFVVAMLVGMISVRLIPRAFAAGPGGDVPQTPR